jgi:hypothetical protein
MTPTQPGKLAPCQDKPAVACDDEETKVRPEETAGPAGQPMDSERPMEGEEDAQLRSHHLETSGEKPVQKKD